VITANNQPVALGLMGGEATEVHAESQNHFRSGSIQLEYSPLCSQPGLTNRGFRDTNAGKRYRTRVACAHALQMIQDLAGGVSVSQQLSDRRVGSKRSVELRLSRVNQVLGPVESEAELQPDEVKRAPRGLGLCYRYCRQSGLDRQRSTVPLSRY